MGVVFPLIYVSAMITVCTRLQLPLSVHREQLLSSCGMVVS